MSQPARSARSVVSGKRPTASSRADCSICPFSTLRVRKWAIRSRPPAARELDLVADHVETRLDRELRDPRAHRAQADDTDDLHSFSTTPAIAMPKPTHIDAIP